MECSLFQLATLSEPACSTWTRSEEVHRMGPASSLEMVREKLPKQSWRSQNIKANTWLQLLRNWFMVDEEIKVP
ncbi:hypothetical protein R3W88_007655 [Solanum pinnatisectum]|uniref:Uncharacterized protein n=1 Tax=Solanum pinnatisectum TaxID=50273 RepID=A0AAV9M876_9SOLN|nr:hypothetical protein R3W88_007655 [Solanum pinnatisectum]